MVSMISTAVAKEKKIAIKSLRIKLIEIRRQGEIQKAHKSVSIVICPLYAHIIYNHVYNESGVGIKKAYRKAIRILHSVVIDIKIIYPYSLCCNERCLFISIL